MVQTPKTSSATPKADPFRKVAECLYRHESSGTYYALVKRSGKQYRRSLGTKDRKLAERGLATFRQKVARLDHSKGKARNNVTFAMVAKQWLATVTPHMKPSSGGRRETSVQQLTPHFANALVRNITSATCEAWAAKRSPGVAGSTYNNERDTLIAIFRYAERQGLLLDNPATVLPRRRLGKTAILIPSKPEFAQLVAKLRLYDVRAVEAANLVEVLAYSGMRLAEATAITWSDVDFDQGRFTVTGGELGTKNHEARVVPLFPAFQAFLAKLRQERKPKPTDRVIGIDNAKTAMRSACTACGLPDFTHHCMRHYFVSNAIEAGVDFKTIAGWVGHKDGGLLVAKTYGHLRDTHSFEMAKRMTFAANPGQPA